MHVSACPHCLEAAEAPIVCDRCGWRWYHNPKPAAGTLVERRPEGGDGEPEVLLLRRAVEPGLGGWDLPAGYLHPHESPEQAARRETLEEAGLQVELLRLIGIYTSLHGNAVSAVFLARPVDPDPVVTLDLESSDFAWVPRREAREWLERMAFPSMAAALTDWIKGRQGLPQEIPTRTAD